MRKGHIIGAWMPMEIEPWLSDADIQSWFDDQEKWYFRLLMQAWKNSENPCHLPNESERLMVLAGVSAADARRVRAWGDRSAAVLRKFVKTEDGKWLFNPKQLEVYVNQLGKIEARKEAGKLGGLSKASKSVAMLQQSSSKQSLSLAKDSSLKSSLDSVPNPEDFIARIRGVGLWRDPDSIAVEHSFFEQVSEKGADPAKLFEQVCRIYVATDSGKFAPKLAEVIRRWQEPMELWGRNAKGSDVTSAEVKQERGKATVSRVFARLREAGAVNAGDAELLPKQPAH